MSEDARDDGPAVTIDGEPLEHWRARIGLTDHDPLEEAVELLTYWFERWRGFIVGDSPAMSARTRALLERHGVELRQIEVRRG